MAYRLLPVPVGYSKQPAAPTLKCTSIARVKLLNGEHPAASASPLGLCVCVCVCLYLYLCLICLCLCLCNCFHRRLHRLQICSVQPNLVVCCMRGVGSQSFGSSRICRSRRPLPQTAQKQSQQEHGHPHRNSTGRSDWGRSFPFYSFAPNPTQQGLQLKSAQFGFFGSQAVLFCRTKLQEARQVPNK
mmetsp:Transcript_2176/g.5185  ORF Transcript_2176/g.5185 Transcript_2176/m.5185 type:complete len:187 (-) Transcript_2176:93-653(-)